jgi:hypothetical protein
MSNNSVLEKLISAADNHGEDSGEPDHTVGDLQDMLREAWRLLPSAQRQEFLESDAVENLVGLGAREEFDVDDLVEQLSAGS